MMGELFLTINYTALRWHAGPLLENVICASAGARTITSIHRLAKS